MLYESSDLNIFNDSPDSSSRTGGRTLNHKVNSMNYKKQELNELSPALMARNATASPRIVAENSLANAGGSMLLVNQHAAAATANHTSSNLREQLQSQHQRFINLRLSQ